MAVRKTILRVSSANTSSPDFAPALIKVTTALAAVLALAAQPALAQDRQDTPSLEDLIPDAAVDNPEEWARDGVSADAAEQENAPLPLDPSSPLAEMPQVTIPWPEQVDLPQLAPLEPEDPIEFATFEEQIPPIPAGSEERISDELVLVFPSETSLFPERDEFLDRFKSLSTIEQLEDENNLARLRVQARNDEELLQQMLRVYGYYDAQVIRSVGEVDEEVDAELQTPAARFDIIPGTRYRFGAVDLGNLAAAGDDFAALRAAFEIYPGDPISLDAIETEQADLDTALGRDRFSLCCD